MLFNKSLNICNYWGRELRLTWPANGWEGDTMGPTDCNDCTSQSQISLFNRKWSKLRAHDATVCREQQQKKKRNTKTKQIRMACYVMGMLRYFWLFVRPQKPSRWFRAHYQLFHQLPNRFPRKLNHRVFHKPPKSCGLALFFAMWAANYFTFLFPSFLNAKSFDLHLHNE